MLPTGVLSEQINGSTGEPVSVAPLVWSQADYANTLLDLVAAKEAKGSPRNHIWREASARPALKLTSARR